MCRGYFFIPITMDSETSEKSEEERTLYFLYDSGATHTFADPDSIERVTGTAVRSNKRIRLRNGHIGDLNFEALPTRIAELDHLSIALGREIDGILAYDAFGKSLLTLDYASAQMWLSDGRLPRPDGETIFSSRGKDKRPWLSLEIAGKRQKLLIDSGASTALALNRPETYPTQSAPIVVSASVRWDHIETRRAARLTDDITIGETIIETPMIESVPGNQLLGGSLLQYFQLTFDPKKKRVRLLPYSTANITMPSEHGWGLIIRPVKTGLRIEDILAHGPAASVDLMTGDTITHVNEKPIAERGCTRPLPSAPITLTRLRDGQSSDVVLDLSAPLVP